MYGRSIFPAHPGQSGQKVPAPAPSLQTHAVCIYGDGSCGYGVIGDATDTTRQEVRHITAAACAHSTPATLQVVNARDPAVAVSDVRYPGSKKGVHPVVQAANDSDYEYETATEYADHVRQVRPMNFPPRTEGPFAGRERIRDVRYLSDCEMALLVHLIEVTFLVVRSDRDPVYLYMYGVAPGTRELHPTRCLLMEVTGPPDHFNAIRFKGNGILCKWPELPQKVRWFPYPRKKQLYFHPQGG